MPIRAVSAIRPARGHPAASRAHGRISSKRQANRDHADEQHQIQGLGAVGDEELAVALEDVVQRLGDGEGPERQQMGCRQRDRGRCGPATTDVVGRLESDESCDHYG